MPVDKDIKRLCSEILGVGAGLEVLRLSTTIDGRTIRKLADRFDFEAFERGGTGKVLIEAKGTFQGVSANQHRSSFRKKLKAEGLWAAPTRGYSRAVGIIFSTWCEGKPRGVDVELLDPDGEPGDHFEDAVREVIRFYARRFDEASGDRGPAQTLFEVAESGELIVADPATLGIKVITEAEENAEDGLLTITGLSRNPSFVGGFHSAKAFPLPLAPDDGLDYGQAYVGVDSQILHAIAHRDFDALLKFHTEEGLFMVREGGFVGHFQLDAYGILRGLMTERPPLMTFGVRAEERPPVTSDALRK